MNPHPDINLKQYFCTNTMTTSKMITLPHWLFALLYLHENLLPVAWPSAGQANDTTTPSDEHENTLSPKHHPQVQCHRTGCYRQSVPEYQTNKLLDLGKRTCEHQHRLN